LQAEAAAGATKWSVMLVDDHALLRTGVANIINQEPDLHVVAEAGNGVEAIDAYERHHPDVTLLDLRMPVMEGVEAVRQIRERDPRARVIVLTTYDTDEEISRALKAGAKAYVLKDISADDRQNLSRTGRGGEAGRRGGARAPDAAGACDASVDGRRQGQQGDRQRARHQRAHGEDPPRTPVREARCHQPDRSYRRRNAAGSGSPRIEFNVTGISRNRL
jgi:DNA-binding NarL/FixJ family response regulator